jgi:hypothetical protein
LAKFWLLALLSEFSTATRDERISINVPATIHQSPTFQRIRGHWCTMQQLQQVPPGDACLYISCPNIIGQCDISHFSINAQPYTVVDCILRQGDCVFLMNQVNRAATHEWLHRFRSFRTSNQDNIHTLRTSWALRDLLGGWAPCFHKRHS